MKEYDRKQKETNSSERRTYHPTRENKKDTIGKGNKSLGKADTPSNKGKQEPRQTDILSKGKQAGDIMGNKGKQNDIMGNKGKQNLREGRHTIQHQGGHLKKTLRTANNNISLRQ